MATSRRSTGPAPLRVAASLLAVVAVAVVALVPATVPAAAAPSTNLGEGDAGLLHVILSNPVPGWAEVKLTATPYAGLYQDLGIDSDIEGQATAMRAWVDPDQSGVLVIGLARVNLFNSNSTTASDILTSSCNASGTQSVPGVPGAQQAAGSVSVPGIRFAVPAQCLAVEKGTTWVLMFALGTTTAPVATIAKAQLAAMPPALLSVWHVVIVVAIVVVGVVIFLIVRSRRRARHRTPESATFGAQAAYDSSAPVRSFFGGDGFAGNPNVAPDAGAGSVGGAGQGHAGPAPTYGQASTQTQVGTVSGLPNLFQNPAVVGAVAPGPPPAVGGQPAPTTVLIAPAPAPAPAPTQPVAGAGPQGRAIGWHVSRDDEFLQAYWDGTNWVRRIRWDGTSWVDAV